MFGYRKGSFTCHYRQHHHHCYLLQISSFTRLRSFVVEKKKKKDEYTSLQVNLK